MTSIVRYSHTQMRLKTKKEIAQMKKNGLRSEFISGQIVRKVLLRLCLGSDSDSQDI